jgi:hypothetical protein
MWPPWPCVLTRRAGKTSDCVPCAAQGIHSGIAGVLAQTQGLRALPMNREEAALGLSAGRHRRFRQLASEARDRAEDKITKRWPTNDDLPARAFAAHEETFEIYRIAS